jgi:hypothetical protein
MHGHVDQQPPFRPQFVLINFDSADQLATLGNGVTGVNGFHRAVEVDPPRVSGMGRQASE